MRKNLEDKLGEVVMAIEGAPDRISEERQARHPRELQEARESLARRRHSDRIWLAHERAEVVEKLASELDRASEIRSFVAAINNEEHAPPTAKRLARWGTKLADHLDLLTSFRIAALDKQPNKSYW